MVAQSGGASSPMHVDFKNNSMTTIKSRSRRSRPRSGSHARPRKSAGTPCLVTCAKLTLGVWGLSLPYWVAPPQPAP
jgi:hypothetical protein